jgi:hypothetical protein
MRKRQRKKNEERPYKRIGIDRKVYRITRDAGPARHYLFWLKIMRRKGVNFSG